MLNSTLSEIIGDCVTRVRSPESLQVVLSLVGVFGAAPPGYRAVVATDRVFSNSGLQVRVPDMPAATNHVFQVRNFHLGPLTPQICDASSIRIGSATYGKVG